MKSLGQSDVRIAEGDKGKHKFDMALRQIVLAEIQRVTAEAKEHTDQFLQRAMDKHQSQLQRELSAKTRELEKI